MTEDDTRVLVENTLDSELQPEFSQILKTWRVNPLKRIFPFFTKDDGSIRLEIMNFNILISMHLEF